MWRILVLLAGLVLLTTSALSSTGESVADTPDLQMPHFQFSPYSNPHRPQFLGLVSGSKTIVGIGCCKVCSVGKACGDTCISREKTCHVGHGCACDR